MLCQAHATEEGSTEKPRKKQKRTLPADASLGFFRNTGLRRSAVTARWTTGAPFAAVCRLSKKKGLATSTHTKCSHLMFSTISMAMLRNIKRGGDGDNEHPSVSNLVESFGGVSCAFATACASGKERCVFGLLAGLRGVHSSEITQRSCFAVPSLLDFVCLFVRLFVVGPNTTTSTPTPNPNAKPREECKRDFLERGTENILFTLG